MTKLTQIQLALSLPILAGLLACGGGGGGGGTTPPPPPNTTATRLDYAPPGSGTYTLVKDNALSTPNHLVLNLMGPVGASGTGVAFFLNADTTKVAWAKPSGADAILAHGGLFDLGAGSPQLAVAKASGDQLQVCFFQKGTTKPAVTFTASSVLATVALDLKAGTPVGTSVTLGSVSGKAILTQGAGAPMPITIIPGTITAN